MAKQILVVLHADGRIEANLSGYQGKECEQEEILKELEHMMARPKEQKRPEYFQQRVQQRHQGA